MSSAGWRRTTSLLIACPLACLVLAGCRTLADRIVEPDAATPIPTAVIGQLERAAGSQSAVFLTTGGMPLAYRELAPAPHGLQYRVTRAGDQTGFELSFGSPGDAAAALQPMSSRGTVIMLHGWGLDGSSMLPWALALGEAGYHSILVDLPGHGASQGSRPGFGPREGTAVAELATALVRDGAISGPVYLMGVSHGAVAALHAGALLGDQVQGVVAISPYASARQAIHALVESAQRGEGGGLRAKAVRLWLRWRYRAEDVDAAMRQAGRRLGVDLASISTGPAVDALRACTVVLHGTGDGLFAPREVQALTARSPLAGYVPLQGENHLTAPLRIDLLAEPLAAWFGQLPRTPCPRFVPLADGSD